MKKFKYRLETLLKVKEDIEKQKQRDLAATTQKVMQQKNELRKITDQNSLALDEKRNKSKDKILVSEMLIYSRYFMKLKRENVAGLELLRALNKTQEEKRLALLEASKAKKIYEELKERDLEKFNMEIKKILQKESDEIGLNVFRLKKNQANEKPLPNK